ncbi:MFS transporter [Ammoniphilus sp. CFH 90114]|uniref:MFS transporter n=1 Tax=Ammoniphilus sp. CFH 90114 TaxID=2493665 RepID=UPI0013E948CB|nr:MFS transporter [Ammoniphilus sp. CFH 90114]
MIKIFMEYRIKPDDRLAYLEVMRKVYAVMVEEQKVKNYQFFEGTDQPSLFVEMFDVEALEDYERLKHLRCEAEPMIDDWVQGGKEKIHMWAFKEMKTC